MPSFNAGFLDPFKNFLSSNYTTARNIVTLSEKPVYPNLVRTTSALVFVPVLLQNGLEKIWDFGVNKAKNLKDLTIRHWLIAAVIAVGGILLLKYLHVLAKHGYYTNLKKDQYVDQGLITRKAFDDNQYNIVKGTGTFLASVLGKISSKWRAKALIEKGQQVQIDQSKMTSKGLLFDEDQANDFIDAVEEALDTSKRHNDFWSDLNDTVKDVLDAVLNFPINFFNELLPKALSKIKIPFTIPIPDIFGSPDPVVNQSKKDQALVLIEDICSKDNSALDFKVTTMSFDAGKSNAQELIKKAKELNDLTDKLKTVLEHNIDHVSKVMESRIKAQHSELYKK